MNKEDETKRMMFTLRKHKCSVTSLLYWHNSSIPILISGDHEGLIFAWNLLTRQPYCTFQCSGQIVSFQKLDNLLVVTSKDHTLRILRFPNTLVSSFSQNGPLASFDLIYEIPVNTLNFSNSVIEQLSSEKYRLWCCNTQSSDSLDIYEFNITDAKSLKRLYKAVSLYEPITQLIDKNTMKFDKLGIIMRFALLDSVVYCGFESGFVIGLHVSKSNGLHIVYISSCHYPDPVLNMTVGSDIKKVISCSTSQSLGLHRAKMIASEFNEAESDIQIDDTDIHRELIQLPIDKISQVEQMDELYVVSSWSGKTAVFQAEDKTSLLEIKKEKAQVSVLGNPIGNMHSQKDFANVKIASMVCIPKISDGSISVAPLLEGEKRRLSRFLQNTWCLIGYEDGSINANQLNITRELNI